MFCFPGSGGPEAGCILTGGYCVFCFPGSGGRGDGYRLTEVYCVLCFPGSGGRGDGYRLTEVYCLFGFPGGGDGGDGYRLGRHEAHRDGGSEHAQPAVEAQDGAHQESHDHRRHCHRNHRIRTRDLLRRAPADLLMIDVLPEGDNNQ